MVSVTTSPPTRKRKACEADTDADTSEDINRNTQGSGTEGSEQVEPPLKKVHRACAGACPLSRSVAVSTETSTRSRMIIDQGAETGLDGTADIIVPGDTGQTDTAPTKMDSEDEMMTDADGFSGDDDDFLETQGSDVESMEEG